MNSIKPKYLRIFSDIHLDFDVPNVPFVNKFDKLWKPDPLLTDKESALILAGDIWHSKKPFSFKGKSWIADMSQQFKYVIIVLGNHDFWGGDIQEEYLNYRTSIASQDLFNVFLLQNSSLYFDGLKIIGATLWTDYLDENHVCFSNAEISGMKDYVFINDGEKKISAKRLLAEHKQSKNYIFENTQKDYADQKIVVITHHSPSYKSRAEHLINDANKITIGLYHSNFDNLIAKSKIDLWIHGHSHYAVNYFINNTKIIANPRGYSDENTGFNPWLLVDTNNLNKY